MAHYNHNGCLDVVRNNKLFYIRRKEMEYYIVLVNGLEEYEDIDKMMAEWVAEGYTNKGYNDVTIKHIKEQGNELRRSI